MGEDQEQKIQASSASDVMATTIQPQFYYYQNPTTGTVSTTALSLDQLIRLLVPVREGMKPILPPHTQCLAVRPTIPEECEDEDALSDQQNCGTPSFGEWKPISNVEVLREAACSQWYLSGGTGGKDPRGPMTSRSIMEAYNQESEKSKLLAFAQDITSAWTSVEELPHLLQVLQTLQPSPVPLSAKEVDSPSPGEKDALQDSSAQKSVVQDELEAFLSSTAAEGADESDDNDDDQGYESDGGTRYVKDPLSGHWIHEALAPPKPEDSSMTSNNGGQAGTKSGTKTTMSSKKSSNKKAKFSKRNARNWIYVTGLPQIQSLDVQEVHRFFGKVGLLDLDPETLQPKLKLYRDDTTGIYKGDASICYARPESVDLALQVLDESPWDEHHVIRVERAKFQAKSVEKDGSSGDNSNSDAKRKKRPISQAQRKVARLALLQAQDEGFGARLSGGRKGLRIVVVKHMLDGIPEAEWESTIQTHCQEIDAAVEKITCVSKTKVVILKFVEPTAAAQAVDAWNGKVISTPNADKKDIALEAIYWDGVTDYTGSSEANNNQEEEQRHEDFGKWLDDQAEDNLPPELRLQVAQD